MCSKEEIRRRCPMMISDDTNDNDEHEIDSEAINIELQHNFELKMNVDRQRTTRIKEKHDKFIMIFRILPVVYLSIILVRTQKLVSSCPSNEEEWQKRENTSHCNTDIGDSYHCIMTSQHSLMEMCKKPKYISYGCPILYTAHDNIIEVEPCPKQIRKCPSKDVYLSNKLYLYPYCTRYGVKSTKKSFQRTIKAITLGYTFKNIYSNPTNSNRGKSENDDVFSHWNFITFIGIGSTILLITVLLCIVARHLRNRPKSIEAAKENIQPGATTADRGEILVLLENTLNEEDVTQSAQSSHSYLDPPTYMHVCNANTYEDLQGSDDIQPYTMLKNSTHQHDQKIVKLRQNY